MVEYRAIPRAAQCQANCGDEARTRTRDKPRGGRSRADPANANQRAQDMTEVVRIDRDQMSDGDGDDVEQATVEIKILEAEETLILEAAGIIPDD